MIQCNQPCWSVRFENGPTTSIATPSAIPSNGPTTGSNLYFRTTPLPGATHPTAMLLQALAIQPVHLAQAGATARVRRCQTGWAASLRCDSIHRFSGSPDSNDVMRAYRGLGPGLCTTWYSR